MGHQLYKLELFRVDDECVWERRETRLPKYLAFSKAHCCPFLSLQHSLRRYDVPLAVGALVFEAFDAHGGVDTLRLAATSS